MARLCPLLPASLTLAVLFACTPANSLSGYWSAQTADGSAELVVDLSLGSYNVSVDGVLWLASGPTAVHVDDMWYQAFEARTQQRLSFSMLELANYTELRGSDVSGEFYSLRLTWMAGSVPVETEFRVYAANGPAAFVFVQKFPNGANGTSLGTSLQDLNRLSSAFPRFDVNEAPTRQLSYYGPRFFWDLDMVNPNHTPGIDSTMTGGLYGGVPLMLYNASSPTLRSAVLSPISHFKVGFQSRPAELLQDLACGVHGRVLSIPENFEHATVLFLAHGINTAMMAWGDYLLARYGKTRKSAGSDVASTLLGYGTDTGAIYWYETEKNKTYEQTILDIQLYHDQSMLPVRYYEIDSWFYYKDTSSGEAGGVKLWEAKPEVFPSGMAAVGKMLGTPLSVHNKYYAHNNEYARVNGGHFDFIVEENASIPLDNAFWPYIMGQASSWGVAMVKQDWLASIYELMLSPSQDVATARTFQTQLGQAAAQAGITVQLCMPVASDVLESVENPAARYIRLSDDYSTNPQQWRISRPGLLAWSLGLVAIKDVFWSVQHESPNQYFFSEPNSALQAAVSALSGGQVAIGDGIGETNVSLVMRTCTADGRILRVARPALPIDASFRSRDSAAGEVWHSRSEAVGAVGVATAMAHYVFAANLTRPFQFRTSDFIDEMDSSLTYVAFDSASGQPPIAPLPVLSASTDFVLEAAPSLGNRTSFRLWVMCPLLNANGWALLGEPSKFVSVSHDRFSNVSVVPDAGGMLRALVIGAPGERVEVYAQTPPLPGTIRSAVCQFGGSMHPGDWRKGVKTTTMSFECGRQTCQCN